VGSVPGGRGAGGRGEATSDEVIWYTPFRWVEAGAALALVRVVSHGGASTAQVALVDRAHLDGRWLPAVVARHAGGAGATLVAPEAAAGCGLTAPVSRLLSRPLLCFQPPAATTLDRRLALEGALVLGLALALLAAAGLVVRASRRAAALARERADFVASVSHELRTPLTTLRMNAELLRDDLVPPDKRARTADAIVAESVRLGRLVENVLETTRLEGGRRPLRAVDLDLAAAVRDLLRAHEPLCAQRGFSVDVQTPDAPVPARADPEALALIVANLVENAVKYGGGDDARTIRVSVEPASSADQGPALVVEDGGPGVPAAEHERIFERFHRVDRPDRAHVAGTGLGLALVRDLARAHGGDATAEPGALGRGLRVRVRFGRLGPGAQRQSSVTSGVRR
jgi:signal transduction histidine kinase